MSLPEEIAAVIRTKIAVYDPAVNELAVMHVSTCDTTQRMDIHFSDGAIWSVNNDPYDPEVSLIRLGIRHRQGPLPADIAAAYEPVLTPLNNDNESEYTFSTALRDVDCGDGFRQLALGEVILATDEYYRGPGVDGGWSAEHLSAGRCYRPFFFEAKPGGFALFRRAK